MDELPLAADLWTRAPRRVWWQKLVQSAPIRILIGWLLVAPLVIAQGMGEISRSGSVRMLTSFGSTLAYLAVVALFAKLVERRAPREIAVERAMPEFAIGFGVGVALLSITVGGLVLLGAYRISSGGEASAMLTTLPFLLPHALGEELIFRIFLFKIAEEAIGTRAAMAIQAALFGLLHASNPAATWISSLAIAVEAGILLAACFMWTRRLWLVWGLHFGWNYAQGSLFGVRISGNPVTTSWLRADPVGPKWLSGGLFGVEASPVAVMVCLLGAIVVFQLARTREPWISFRTARASVNPKN